MKLKRTNPNLLEPSDPLSFPVRVFANDQVPIDRKAIQELEEALQLSGTIEQLNAKHPEWFDQTPEISEVILTPDFHKGSGIPIGTVMRTKGFLVPQGPGKDVNCGMCLYRTDLKADQVRACLPELVKDTRRIFFEGGRQIPMNAIQRQAMLTEGLFGLLETCGQSEKKGLWSLYDPANQEDDLSRVDGNGSALTDAVLYLDDYLGSSNQTYDSQIGSIGGGNHFSEVQRVVKIHDSRLAYEWGLKLDQVVVMVHSGSLGLGQMTGNRFKEVLQGVYPSDMKYPDNGLFILPESEKFKPERDAFLTSFKNASNFAYANRMFLALMMFQVLQRAKCREFRLVYGSGHNLIWKEPDTWLHRKGACTARGPEQMAGTPFEYSGEPVIIPGSMGASSFLLVGKGYAESISSASHGAGRALSRGAATHSDRIAFEDFRKNFTVVTPVDPDRADFKRRPDILAKWESEMMEECPAAYKDIGPIIQTQVDAGIASVVAELEPLFTVKG